MFGRDGQLVLTSGEKGSVCVMPPGGTLTVGSLVKQLVCIDHLWQVALSLLTDQVITGYDV